MRNSVARQAELPIPGQVDSVGSRAWLEHGTDFRHEPASSFGIVAFVNVRIEMVFEHILPDEPSHCAARYDIGSVMLARREP